MAAGGSNTFTGEIHLTVLEASGLHAPTLPGGFTLKEMDPYCVIDFDDIFFGTTTHKLKTMCPVWNEEFGEQVEDAERMQVTVFHKSTIPPDPFIAHAQIYVEDLRSSTEDDFVVSQWVEAKVRRGRGVQQRREGPPRKGNSY